jgi:hypothetical protein
MMENTIFVQSQPIRTDWINKIQRWKENGTLTCTIWLSVGPVGVYAFTGRDAKTALQLLAKHPALRAPNASARRGRRPKKSEALPDGSRKMKKARQLA